MNALAVHTDLVFDSSIASRRDALRPASPKPAGVVVHALRWLIDLPRRRAVINELQELSDHELADIGLERSELGRVFERDFASRRAD